MTLKLLGITILAIWWTGTESQSYPPRPSLYQPRTEDYNLPPFYQPHPGRDASSLTPIFPFHSEFNTGLDVNPGSRVTVDGNLNVPIMGWGIWDYKGGVKVGRPNTRVGVGTLHGPTNVLGISPETVAALASDPTFNRARNGIPSIPVSVLPGNFVPLRCKPPLCNPFVHNLAFGVDVEPGDDYLFDGGLDFPVPLAPGGVGVRMPINGAVNVGTDPLLITYGHGMGPVEPPGFKITPSKMRSARHPRLPPRISEAFQIPQAVKDQAIRDRIEEFERKRETENKDREFVSQPKEPFRFE
ncbi:unnamed protein product, partial [Mesorhabditis spiculigera]